MQSDFFSFKARIVEETTVIPSSERKSTVLWTILTYGKVNYKFLVWKLKSIQILQLSSKCFFFWFFMSLFAHTITYNNILRREFLLVQSRLIFVLLSYSFMITNKKKYIRLSVTTTDIVLLSHQTLKYRSNRVLKEI